MAPGTLELEDSAPYLPLKDAWCVNTCGERPGGGTVEKQQEVASRLKQLAVASRLKHQAVASTLNLTMKQDSFAENPQSSDLLLPHIIDMPWANSVKNPLQTKLPGSRQAVKDSNCLENEDVINVLRPP